jgi:CDP-diacylglycerol pyrophosphatase
MNLRLLLALLALLAVAGPARAEDPDALWKIISQKCLPSEREYGQPTPCAVVDLKEGDAHGYVVLKDRTGATQYLVMPTAKITGIEDPAVLAPGAANYFADAWRERHFTIDAADHELGRDELSLAINSVYGRSQNQLHIHIDCVAPAVKAAVGRQIAAVGEKWAPFPEPLAGHRYRAIRVDGQALEANPFLLIADGVPGARAAMGKETLVVVGATFAGAKPGFVILDTTADPATGNRANGEELQDHSCALGRG